MVGQCEAGFSTSAWKHKYMLVSRLRSAFAESFDLVDDGISRRRLGKRFRLGVVMREVGFNRRFQRAHVLERPTTNALCGDVPDSSDR